MSNKLVDTVSDAAASAVDMGAELVEEVEERITKGKRRAKKAVAKAEWAASKKVRAAEKKVRAAEKELRKGKRKAEAKIKDAVELPKRKSKGAKVGKLVGCVAILAGVVAAIRQFIATNDSGWQPHEPSDPYVSPSASNVAEDIADDIETDSSNI